MVQVALVDNERVPWHNATRPLDVNDDGVTAPLDALHIINTLNQLGSRSLPTERTLEAPYYDVNFDGIVSPADVLHIINFLNRTASSAEGEVSDPQSQTEQPLAPDATDAVLPVVPVTPDIADLYYRGIDRRYQSSDEDASERDAYTHATPGVDDFWSWLGSMD